MAPPKSDAPNVYAHRGRYLLSQYHERNKNISQHELSQMKRVLRNPGTSPEFPICIIGAGIAALYTAMILESLGIDYQIVDADTRDRVGGRLWTFHFPNGGPYDYCVCWTPAFSHRSDICVQEVGAMRFPDTPFMKRFFDLATNRNLPVRLIPYIIQMIKPSPNTFLFYNNRHAYNQDSTLPEDPFNVSGYLGDTKLATPQAVHKKVAEVLQPFRDLFRAKPGEQPPDIATAISELFRMTNRSSMRSHMFEILGMNSKDVHWCETLDTFTGSYDRALTEST
jgi:hypothetical protein